MLSGWRSGEVVEHRRCLRVALRLNQRLRTQVVGIVTERFTRLGCAAEGVSRLPVAVVQRVRMANRQISSLGSRTGMSRSIGSHRRERRRRPARGQLLRHRTKRRALDEGAVQTNRPLPTSAQLWRQPSSRPGSAASRGRPSPCPGLCAKPCPWPCSQSCPRTHVPTPL